MELVKGKEYKVAHSRYGWKYALVGRYVGRAPSGKHEFDILDGCNKAFVPDAKLGRRVKEVV